MKKKSMMGERRPGYKHYMYRKRKRKEKRMKKEKKERKRKPDPQDWVGKRERSPSGAVVWSVAVLEYIYIRILREKRIVTLQGLEDLLTLLL